MPRINRVTKSRKEHTCAQCGITVRVGEPYKYIEPRYGPKRVHCSSCNFRPSHLTSSDKLKTLYEAREELQYVDRFYGDSKEEAEVFLQELADLLESKMDEVEEVADEYEESASNVDEHFPGSPQVGEMQEKSDAAREFAEAIEVAKDEISSLLSELEGLEEPDEYEEGTIYEDKMFKLEDEIERITDDACSKVKDISQELQL